jgi:UDP-N-acetyl-2-amino-2-deoxyglucuronate dehydrogenase
LTIRFGIVGCGLIADFHARAIADTRGAKLVGCTSRSEESSARFAKKHKIPAYPDIDALLAENSVDAISVCTPSGAHHEPAMRAIRAGKHVVVEKPLEISLARCDQMIAAADKKGVVLSTIFQSRFHDSARTLKRAVEQLRFGPLILADGYVKWYRSQEYYNDSAWKGTWALDGGGALMNQAIHCVDLLLWLVGPVESVTAQASTRGHEDIEVEDVLVATMRFAHGAIGVLEATTCAYPGMLKRVEISGTQGSATLEEESIVRWDFAKTKTSDAAIRGDVSSKSQGGGASHPAAISHQGHARQYQDIVKAIKNGDSPLIDGHEARQSVELVLAIYQAARTGRSVTLPLKRDPKLTNKPFPG